MNRFLYPRKVVEQAKKYLKTKKGDPPPFVKKYPGEFTVKKGVLYGGGKQVVATEDRHDFLQDIVYGKGDFPFGRDSLFHILKRSHLNVSKRDIEAYLNAQGPVIHRRARPKKDARQYMRKVRKVGTLSIDLVHIRAKDFENMFPVEDHGEPSGYDYMGLPGDKGYQQDRYMLNAVDLLTGFLLTEILQGKKPEMVVPKLKKIIQRFETASKQKVLKMETDDGGEFKGVVNKFLKERGIKKIIKTTNAIVENKNATVQRVFFTIVQERRIFLTND